MSPNEAQEAFLREGNVAVLATVDRRGRAHAAPIWYIYADGVFVMSTGRGSQKHRNIDANPEVTLVIDRRSLPYYYLTARGRAEIGPSLSRGSPTDRFPLSERGADAPLPGAHVRSG